MPFALSVFLVLILLVASELWWRRRDVHGEFSRKFVHITVGSFVAFWPYFLTPRQIMLLSLAFLVGVAVSKYLNIFQAIHSVQRPTLGEFWFALVVGLLALITDTHPHIYTTALLVMALADGLAAVVGIHFGNGYRYVVFGSPKSILGTATFFATTCLILTGYVLATPGALALSLIFPIAAVATILENVAVRGLDNLLVPLFMAGTLLLLV
ncbi:MAG: phosphatidate cytidylyltransferase [Candidatus Saccharibacteria bacterium]|nr:phosphatidate cytidylyltransferase [Candidatus Saccharibacteria bacterium]